MAITVTNIGTASGKAVSSLSITVPVGGVPAGSLIVVAYYNIGGFGASVTDTAGNSYINGPNRNAGWAGGEVEVKYAFNCAALVSGNTISISITSTTIAATAFYATGVQTASDPGDAIGTGTSTGSASPTATTSVGGGDGAGTTAVSGELLVGIIGSNGPSGDSFSQDLTNQGGFSAPPPTRVGTTGGSATSNATIAGGVIAGWGSTGKPKYNPAITSRSVGTVIVTFKGVSSTPQSKPFRRPLHRFQRLPW